MSAEAPAWEGRIVLVTGGAGFIGSHLVDALVGAGARVRVLDNLSSGRDRNLFASGEKIEFMLGDLRDVQAVRKAIGEEDWAAEVVLHLGALGSVPRSIEDPLTTHEVNASGTLNVLACSRKVALDRRKQDAASTPLRVVLASSSSVYGDVPGDGPRDEMLGAAPLSPYAASKVAGEAYARAFHARGLLETCVLRFFNVYGPRQDPESQYAAVVPRFFVRCRAGQSPIIYGDGEQRRDFTYVADVVEACMLAGSAPDAAGTVCNIGAGQPESVNELAAMVIAACGLEGSIQPEHVPPREGDVRNSHASIERAAEHLGWRPSTPLHEGLRKAAIGYPRVDG